MVKQPTKQRSVSARIHDFFASERFFWLVLGVFVFQAAWIAVTARYPQAFDEQFHYGIIKLYAVHGSPFWVAQPVGSEQFGAVTRDPSFLYQYLLSFPYRLLVLVTNSDTTRIVILRLFNVGFMAAAIVMFRRVLALLGASNAMRNIVMTFVVLTPVVSLLAAQINYDNLLTLLAATAFWVYLTFHHQLRRQRSWSWLALGQLLIISAATSVVKYAFLPIALGLWLLVAVDWRYARRHLIPVLPRIQTGLPVIKLLLYTVVIAISLGLCSERYVINTVRYHNPIPECDQVLSVESCQSYAPWARNYMFDSWNIQLKHSDKLTYPFTWLHIALGELVFTISSNFNNQGLVEYHAQPQLPVPEVLSWAVFVGGTGLTIFYWRKFRSNRALIGLLGVAGFYLVVLFTQNTMEFLHIGLPVAIHGRYLMPILPLLYFTVALGFRQLLRQTSHSSQQFARRTTLITACIVIVFAFEGGGFTTFIVRSQNSWFWPQSSSAQRVNQYARNVLKPITLR